MKNCPLVQVLLWTGFLLLSSCANVKQGEQNVISAGSKQEERKQKTSVLELRRLYDAAKSEYERRTVCLRAIDERTIHRGGEVSTVDAILGTHFSAELSANDSLRWNIVHFDSGAPGVYDERGWVKDSTESGWYLAIKSDWHGHILHYYLSNLHRNPSTLKPKREGREQKALILELKQLYETAKSEDERREVCLRAIDAGIIYYLGPVSSVDAIFGTSYATNPPEAYQSLGYYGYITIGSRLPDMIDKRGRPLFGGFAGWEFGFYYDRRGKYSNTTSRTCTNKNLYLFKRGRTMHKILIGCLLLLLLPALPVLAQEPSATQVAPPDQSNATVQPNE